MQYKEYIKIHCITVMGYWGLYYRIHRMCMKRCMYILCMYIYNMCVCIYCVCPISLYPININVSSRTTGTPCFSNSRLSLYFLSYRRPVPMSSSHSVNYIILFGSSHVYPMLIHPPVQFWSGELIRSINWEANETRHPWPLILAGGLEKEFHKPSSVSI